MTAVVRCVRWYHVQSCLSCPALLDGTVFSPVLTVLLLDGALFSSVLAILVS